MPSKSIVWKIKSLRSKKQYLRPTTSFQILRPSYNFSKTSWSRQKSTSIIWRRYPINREAREKIPTLAKSSGLTKKSEKWQIKTSSYKTIKANLSNLYQPKPRNLSKWMPAFKLTKPSWSRHWLGCNFWNNLRKGQMRRVESISRKFKKLVWRLSSSRTSWGKLKIISTIWRNKTP